MKINPPLSPTPEAVVDFWFEHTRITPVSARRFDCERDWHQHERRLPDAMWYWFARGGARGWLGSRRQTVDLPEGSLWLIPRAEPHEAWARGRPLVAYTVHFHAELPALIDLPGVLNLRGLFLRREAPCDWGGLTERLAREDDQREPGWRLALRSGIGGLLVALARLRRIREGFSAASGLYPALSGLQPVLEIIESELGRAGLSVGELAAAAHVSEVTLRKRFHRAFGLGPLRYLRRRRIEKAAELLRDTGEDIKSIAARCGFSDLPFFHHTFRRLIGLTPGRFRAGGGV